MNKPSDHSADLSPEKKRALLAHLLEEEAGKSSLFALSFAQQRLWFLHQLEPTSPAYNISIVMRLVGRLDVSAFERSIDEIALRHEILRTTFATADGQPTQIVAPTPSPNVTRVDLQHLPTMERKSEAQRLAAEEIRKPFDLERGPLLRVTLLQTSQTEHILALVMHHIISDGWSIGVFFRELSALYAAFLFNQPPSLPNLSIQYVDFAHWQRKWLQGDVLQIQLTYWMRQLAAAPPMLKLPTDKPRSLLHSFSGATQHFHLDSDLTQAIRALGQQSGATLFMTLLSALAILLGRYSGQEDIVIGSPIANRNRREIETLVGLFANTLALRIDLSGNPTFRELLARVRALSLGAYAHQDFPFEKLVDAIQPERDLSHTPLFQVMFVLQNTPQADLALPGLIVEPVKIDAGTAKFDLSLSLEQTDQGLAGELKYNTDLFETSTIARMVTHLQTLLGGIIANPDGRLSELPFLTKAELHRLLVEWNDTETNYPQHQCIHRLFESQVVRTPKAVATLYKENALSYEELNHRANQLAHYLQGMNVGPEALVGICLERSLEMMVSVLAVLKAGGAYVPLDPTYPQERLAFMLQDARVPVLLTQQRLLGQLPEHGAQVVCLDTDWPIISQQSQANPISNTLPDNVAYVIYTSGSTGEPKGVVVQHRSVLNLLTALERAVYPRQRGRQLRVSLNGSLSFDTSVKQWIQLLNGHRLDIIPAEIRFDGDALLTYLQRHELDVFDCTPVQLELLLEAGLLFKAGHKPAQVLVAGEAIGESTWQVLSRATEATFYNLYGPTECTVDTTATQVEPATSTPTIGRPLANVQVYILDQRLQPVPVGTPGELHVGGAGLARGYLNRPGLTAENFLPNPFSDEPGIRLYKTGDLARYLPDGNIEFVGRVDRQVKIRGFRIELGEIEAALEQHPAIQQTAIIASSFGHDHNHERVMAYVLPKPKQTPTVDELRGFLKQKLPDYMVPSVFAFLDTWPLTPSGKVDHNRLPQIEQSRPELTKSFVPPRTWAEKVLAGIWCDLLGIDRVGVHDNFFELGGDSILSIQIVSRANQAGLRLTPRQLFQHQTVAALATAAGPTLTRPAKQGPVVGRVPLTPIQRRFFEQDLSEFHHWNQAILLETRQPLDPTVLEKTMLHLASHHDALRLRFVRTGSGWQQYNAEPGALVPIRQVDLSALPQAEQDLAIEAIATQLQASLNLSQEPLVRVALFDLGSRAPNRFLIIAHHLLVDGVSWRILLEDFQTVYQQIVQGETVQLAPKTASFKQWAEQLTEYARSTAIKQELDHWLAAARAQVPRLALDYPEGLAANTEASARIVSVSLNAKQTRALLQEVPRVYKTQINEVLLTALAQVFARWTGENTLLFDLEGHGREEIAGQSLDLSRTVGWFTSVFPVFLRLDEAAQPGLALRSVKEQFRRIPNKGVGYGVLRYLSDDAETAWSGAARQELRSLPQAEMSFNYLGRFDQILTEPSLFEPAYQGSPFGLDCEHSGPARSLSGKRRYLLEVNGSITGDRLHLDWTYSQNVHRRATIERLAEDLMETLRALIVRCQSQTDRVVGYTPSDFPLAKIDRQTVDRLTAQDQPAEDIYPLSPGQQEMFSNTPQSGAYFLQWVFGVRGDLDVHAFRRAWQQVVDRHTVLRTALAWEGLDQPLQIVYERVELPWQQQDWRDLAAEEQPARLESFLRAELERGFELSRAPLMRLTLIQLGEGHYQFVWSHHHLLLDGWSITPLWREVFAFYEAYRQNQELHLEAPYPYRDYIAWLQQQDLTQAEAFWRAALQGVTQPTPLVIEAQSVNSGAASRIQKYAEQSIRLSSTATDALQSFAKRHRLTLNTLVLGAWALLLSGYSDQGDVVFGVTVSGRPADLPGVESRLGMFVNTLPMRVKICPETTLSSWLEGLQNQQIELRQYQYTPLAQIEEWCPVFEGLPCFDSFLRFQNYPLEASLWEPDSLGGVEIQDLRVSDWWHYPLGVVAGLDPDLWLRITYDPQRFGVAAIVRVLRHVQSLLESFAINPERRLEALMLRQDCRQ